MLNALAVSLLRRPRLPSLLPSANLLALAGLLTSGLAQASAPPPAPPEAQAPAATVPTAYDVIAIRPSHSNDGNSSINPRGVTFDGVNINLTGLLVNAYGIRPDLIYGKPAWVESKRWDIHAKISDMTPEAWEQLRVTREQREQLALSLLTDRFHLKAHWETKELPVYDLVIGRGGPKFAQNAAENAADLKAAPPGGMMFRMDASTQTDIVAEGTLSSLNWVLANAVNREVIDKTGLTDKISCVLKFARQDVTPSEDNPAPSIFTAVEEQLGLKLVPSRGPVKIVIIDHIEQPTEN